MDIIHRILQTIPLFTHLSDAELRSLVSIAKIEKISKGSKIDIKKFQGFGIVLRGLFELGNRGRGEILYLAPGSFYGDILFLNNKHTGSLRALEDSSIVVFDPGDLYKIFLSSYRGLRGYIRNIERSGFTLGDAGKDFISHDSKVIVVYSPDRNSGKSVFAAMLALSLFDHGKTIILDGSYDGDSIFNIFEKEPHLPIAQRSDESAPEDISIDDKIENINDNLSLFNITSGSKVNIDPEIISPILCILSGKFKYIIIELSDHDILFRNKVFSFSDIIFSVLKNINDRMALYNSFDSELNDGQRVYYILNRFYAKDTAFFDGGYMFENLGFNKKETLLNNIQNYLNAENETDQVKKLVEIILLKKTALVIQTGLIDSVFLSGLFCEIYRLDKKIDIIYSTSWSYLVSIFFLLSKNIGEFEKSFIRNFSSERLNSFIDITFPEDHVFRNNKIFRFARELAGDSRIEQYDTLFITKLIERDSAENRIFSAGYIRDLFTASFLIDPVFESINISNKFYHSGFPQNRARLGEMYRTDIDEVLSVTVKNKQKLKLSGKKLTKFHKKYIENLLSIDSFQEINFPDKEIVIEVDETNYNPEAILESSKEICKGLISN